jgi:hypothetical protein
MLKSLLRWGSDKVLDLLLGEKEEFDYVSTTAPPPIPNEL